MTCEHPTSELSLQVCGIHSFSPPGRRGYFSDLKVLYTLYLQYKCRVQTPVAAKWHLDFLPSSTIFQSAAVFFL